MSLGREHSRFGCWVSDGPVAPGSARLGLAVLIAVCAVCWSGGVVHAVPARPKPIAVNQPDGAAITLYVKGDEAAHWYEDAAGNVVTKCPKTGQWVYGTVVDGAIQPTALVAGRDDPKGVAQVAASASRIRAAVRDRKAARAAKESKDDGPLRAGPRGTMQNLVILVNFTDKTIAQTPQQFDDLFNEIGYSTDGAAGSVKDYYLEVSYGALTIQSTVVEAVTLDYGYAYYGQNDAYGEDLLPAAMVRDALVKLEARGFDFSQMDGDGDGYVDGLTVVHAGEGEENGTDPNAIWSHKWQLGNPVTYDGVVLEPYVTVPAIRDGSGAIVHPGVICHELGHHLGLPDLYDIDYTSEGAGQFCLMAGGSWNGGNGESPAQMSAWCKVTLDWVQPTIISTAGAYSLGQVETNAQIYKIQGAFSANEFFLIENRQGVSFDASLPGSSRGILIWHVDENQPDNSDETHYLVDLEEAGGTQDLESAGGASGDDDYFRQGNATEFNSTTTPSSASYDGTPLGLGMETIGPTGSTMLFSVVMVDPLSISGYVATADGAGIDGVLISEDQDGGWDVTDTDGYYRLPVRYGWSGTVTPTKTGYEFGPASRTYENVTASLSSQNYTGAEDGGGGGTGTLSITTVDDEGDPVDGAIYVDGDYKGTGSWSAQLATGTYQVTYGDVEGYTTPNANTVAVQDGQTTNVTGTYATGTSGSSLQVTVTADPNLVAPGNSSLVVAQASGGVSPYDYLWNTGYTRATFISQPKVTTTYTVTVTDNVGATAEGSVTINVPADELTVTVQADPNVVSSGESSTVTATAAGGVEPYEYAWNTGDTDAAITVSPTEPTTYTVTATDLSGQTAIASITVSTTQVAGVTDPAEGTPCFAPMAPMALLLTAMIGWRAAGARSSTRRKTRRRL